MISTGGLSLPVLRISFFSILLHLTVVMMPVFFMPPKAVGQYEQFRTPFFWPGIRSGMPQEEIRSLAVAPDGAVWLSCPSGLFRWNGQRGERFSGRYGIPSGNFQYLAFDSSGALTGLRDSVPFRYDGAVFMIEENSHEEATHLQEEFPAIKLGDVRYTGTDRGLLIEYFNGWETLNTPGCDMPWSVIPDPGGEGFLLPCYLLGFQRFDWDGNMTATYDLPAGGLNTDEVQLFPGYLCRGEYGCLTGGLRGPYSIRDGKTTFWGRLGYTVETLAWDTVTQKVFAAGNNISFLRPDGTMIPDAITIPEDIVSIYTAYDMLVDREHIWVVGMKGAGRYDREKGDWTLFTRENGKMPSVKSQNLHRSPHGRLYVGMQDGLGRWNGEEERFERILPALIDETVGQVTSWHKDTLIVVSSTRCYFFHENRDGLTFIISYGPEDGVDLIEFNENGAMIDGNDRLYLSGPESIHRFDLTRLRSVAPPAPSISVKSVGAERLPFTGKTVDYLSRRGEDLTLVYDLHGPGSSVALAEYRLDGGPWEVADAGDELAFPELLPGPHLIELRARVEGLPEGNWPVKQLRVLQSWPTLQYPLMQRLLILVIALVIILLVYFNWIAYRERRQLRRMQRQMIDATNRAMEVQLNPDFILKGIDGIQQRIDSRERKTASQYLVHLARTLRQLLDISLDEKGDGEPGIRLVSLDREIKFLRDLIQLEQNRRPEDFSFILSIDEDLWEEDPEIPSLLLPPVVSWLINLDNAGLTPVGDLRLTIDGTPERIRIRWLAHPIKGHQFNISDLRFSNTMEGRSLAERARLFSQLGYRLSIEPQASEEEFELVMVWKGR